MSVGDPGLRGLVELAQERLLMEGNWPGVLQRLGVRVHGGVLTLPDEFDGVYSVVRGDIGGMEIVDPWYTLLPQNQVGTRYPPLSCEDRGESAVYRQPGGRKLKAYSEDGSGITVWADGEEVLLEPGSRDEEPVATGKAFYQIQRVEREGAGRPFELVYEDVEGKETFGGRYSGYWPAVTLRSYDVGDFEGVVDVVARRRVIPVTGDRSPLVVGNLAALRLMVISLQKEETGEVDAAEANLQRAIRAMRSENARYHPHQQQPRLQPQEGFGDIGVI